MAWEQRSQGHPPQTSGQSRQESGPSAASVGQRGVQSSGESGKPGIAAPSISLPKGGGAIRGIGEKFSANPVTGTSSMTVPIATSPGRSGFGPQLSLSYDSGAGNGPFGFGWSLSVPNITRKTDKGLPRYWDDDESDEFILSGAEDLVPVYRQDCDGAWVASHPVCQRDLDTFWVRDREGNLVIHDDELDGYLVRRYRPRIEGLFARIERWCSATTGEIYWRAITKDNITSIYGDTADSRIADPADDSRVFSWLLSRSYDDKGNVIVYRYAPENNQNVPAALHEDNRQVIANRHLKRIKYGNRQPNRKVDEDGKWIVIDPAQLPQDTWMFEVVFDYGEGHYAEDEPDAEGRIFAHAQVEPPADSHWRGREDPFSSYRAGFEVRTYRLCRRVLMFHHFPDELGEADYLVRSTEFLYDEGPVASFITAVTQSGFVLQDSGYLKRSLPPVEFTYSGAKVDETVHTVDPASLENLPIGLDGSRYQWVDLDGEGLSGILTEQGEAWFYKRNLSPITTEEDEDKKPHVIAGFAPQEIVRSQASLADLAGGRQQFLDLAGDGTLDLVQLDGPAPGFYERTDDGSWERFRAFTSLPNVPWHDPNLKFVDLTGDGHADVLISEDAVFTWYPSLAEAGFGPATYVRQPIDEEQGPRLVFADGTQSIYLADMSGDGLTDLVRIRNGEVCYWPNLGYGRFGTKISMSDAPWFDHPDQFDQRRIRLADIDGSGNTDIIYLGRDAVRLYFNRSGNSWSPPHELSTFPAVDNLASIMAVDLLGNGTACLVWSSPLPGNVRQPMRYIELMGEGKPHLLVKVVNNLGAETHVFYAPSTKFYLADKLAGMPWVTRLPFPVHVVERVETHDHISSNRFVTRYAYHHGYFDGEEREFRGFGRVDQWDTEEFAVLSASNDFPAANNIDAASHVPPVLTKTWFHTGAYLGRDQVSNFFAGLLDSHDQGEYYREPAWRDDDVEARKRLLADTVLPDGLSIEEEREACRALKGSMLRQEVYAQDDTAKAEHPYTVTEQNFTINLLQPRAGNRHAVFFTSPNESLAYHYEREPADPRIQHTLTLEVDSYGNVMKEAAIGYGRRQSPLAEQWDRDRQEKALITYTEHDFTNPIDDVVAHADDYRTPLTAETRTYELTGCLPTGAAGRYCHADFVQADGIDPTRLMHIYEGETPYEDTPPAGKQRRLIERFRTLYRKDDLTAFLPLGEVQPLALPGDSYKLSLTPSLLARVFKRKHAGQPDEELLSNPSPLLEGKGADQGGYVAWDGAWWIPAGRVFYDPDANIANPTATALQELNVAHQHFFLPRKFADSFDHCTTVDYAHDLLVARTEDALHNTVIAANDYRVLQPRLITDPNRNRTAVGFDALGLVVATAVMGKEDQKVGDLLEGFDANPTLADLQGFVVDPQGQAAGLLGQASTRIVYDLDRYQRTGQPAFAATLARETHFHDLGGAQSKTQIAFSYSDGFGREIQKKIQAEAGDAPQRQANVLLPNDDIRPGDLVRTPQGKLVQANAPRRWVGTGLTVFNNKGKPVRQYEPFFSATHLYEAEPEMTDAGVSSVLFYDPVERVVATLHPNHTYEKVVFDAWQQETWDVNDTVLVADPKTDADVGNFFRRLPEAEYLPTWFALRTEPAHAAEFAALYPDPSARTSETEAAQKAAAHADTPTVAHFDTLGRTFLTVAQNKVVCPGHALDGTNDKYHTRVELDIEGNQRAVRDAIVQNGDALGRVVMRYDYDMLGNRIHQASMEAGERWMLNDVTGKPIRAWDSRGFLRRMSYDELRRPTDLYATEKGTERLAERTVYGEGQGDAGNHYTRVWQVYDGAGIVTNVGYDFKGNLNESRRDLLPTYKQAVDWQQNPAANDGSFSTRTTYDALNRPTNVITPDGSIYRPTFNEANLLDKVDVSLRGAALATSFVSNINYNAKGQRELIVYGNRVETKYEYDPFTYRLTHMKSTRPAGLNGLASRIFANPAVVQDLHYTYDPIGNITRIADVALKTAFNGQQIDPVCRYTYDAIYRLIEATGREHLGQTVHDFNPPPGERRDYPFMGQRAHPNDPEALRNYTEHYEYDGVGNFEAMRHTADNGNWTRRYEYAETSLLEASKQSNRLTRTTVGNGFNQIETYGYTDAQGNDVHGCMTAINTMKMTWDFEDQLQEVDLGGGGTAYYVYDAAGQRVRKVIESQNEISQHERIYLGNYEIYRQHAGEYAGLVRETLHVMDDKQRIALVETRNEVDDGSPKQVMRYQLGNHLGSAGVELDREAALISYEEYHPYGTTAFQAGRNAMEVKLKRYRYTGKERDEESGLYYHGARYYASWLARWMGPDPVGLLDGADLYWYARANPIRYVDPVGRDSSEPAEQKLVRYTEVLTTKLPAKARESMSQIAGTDRRLLALQKYLGMNNREMDRRWAWSQAEFEQFQSSSAGQALRAELTGLRQQFGANNPTYSLRTAPTFRSLESQIRLWNQNASVGRIGQGLREAALKELRRTETILVTPPYLEPQTCEAHACQSRSLPKLPVNQPVYPDVPGETPPYLQPSQSRVDLQQSIVLPKLEIQARGAADDPAYRRFGRFLANELRRQQRPTSATPGLSLHGQARAIDFLVFRGNQMVVGPGNPSLWRSTGLAQRLANAIHAAGPNFRGPLLSPDEPWHYNYER